MNIQGHGGGFFEDDFRYREWRELRLGSYPRSVEEILVPIDGLLDISDEQVELLKAACRRANMVIYQCRDPYVDRAAVVAFASRFGLCRLDHHLCANEDGVSELTVAHEGIRTGYVPYSDRSLSWHTDGYYNEKNRQINAVVLHCAQAALHGGENALLDPVMAYIKLRDEDPRFIAAFEHPECMTIPANTGADGEIRAEVCGPVLSYDSHGEIHMRYSARKKNIQWRDDAVTTAAREFLSEILDHDKGLVFHYRLQPGEGLLSNNVLHNRTSFSDGQDNNRLLYRARFFERIET